MSKKYEFNHETMDVYPSVNRFYKPTGTISACAPDASTCAANPIHVEKITPEMIVDASKQLSKIEEDISKFDKIVKVFNEKNDLLRECLFFLSAFVDDDFCYDLKTRIENHLGLKCVVKKKGGEEK